MRKKPAVDATPLPKGVLDRLTKTYRYYAESRPGWTVAAIDMTDLRAVLSAHGIEISA